MKLIHFGSPKAVEYVVTADEVQRIGGATLDLLNRLPMSDGGEPDMVNHPPHYTSDPSGVECITITRHRNFNIGNAIKYLWRAGLKDTGIKVPGAGSKEIEDLKKAIFYIQDEIERIEGRDA